MVWCREGARSDDGADGFGPLLRQSALSNQCQLQLGGGSERDSCRQCFRSQLAKDFWWALVGVESLPLVGLLLWLLVRLHMGEMLEAIRGDMHAGGRSCWG